MLLIVHGHKLRPDGSMTDEFKGRVLRALEDATEADTLIVTGGVTREGTRSEASLGAEYIRTLGHAQLPKVLTETVSTSTGENVLEVRELARRTNLPLDEVAVYHRWSSVPKTKVLYRKLWPELKNPNFIGCDESSSFIYKIVDRTLMVFLAHVDPHEKSWIWRMFKRMARNAKN